VEIIDAKTIILLSILKLSGPSRLSRGFGVIELAPLEAG